MSIKEGLTAAGEVNTRQLVGRDALACHFGVVQHLLETIDTLPKNTGLLLTGPTRSVLRFALKSMYDGVVEGLNTTPDAETLTAQLDAKRTRVLELITEVDALHNAQATTIKRTPREREGVAGEWWRVLEGRLQFKSSAASEWKDYDLMKARKDRLCNAKGTLDAILEVFTHPFEEASR